MAANTALVEAFLKVVGWRATGDLPGEELPESLTTSDSGLFVQDVAELFGLDVLRQLVPAGDTLPKFLERITKDTLTKLLPRILAAQNIVPTKPLLEDVALVRGDGQLSNTIVKQGRFIGFRLLLPSRKGVATHLVKVALQLDQAQNAVPASVYVYRTTGNGMPLAEIVVPVYRAGIPGWATLPDPLALPAGEEVYIGYYEDDLQGYAIRRDWKPAPCYCIGDTWPLLAPHVAPESVSFPASAVNEDRSRPLLSAQVVETSAMGLNLELLVACDAAAVLTLPANRLLLAEAIQLALAIRVLTAITTSPRVNQITGRDDIQADAFALLSKFTAQLYGGEDKATEQSYPGLVKNIKLDAAGLHDLCLPKPVSYGFIGSLSR